MRSRTSLSLSSVVVQERETDFQKAISLGKEEEGIEEGVSAQVSGKAVV